MVTSFNDGASAVDANPDSEPISDRDFAARVRELGGILPALASGIDPWRLADGEVRSTWLELQRCWDRLKDLGEEAANALTFAENRPR